MPAISSAVNARTIFAGDPAHSWPSGTVVPGVTIDAGATIEFDSTTDPSKTWAASPIKTESFKVAAWIKAPAPTVTWFPMCVEKSP